MERSLICDHARCETPVARVRGGQLEILVKHHGQKHLTRIPLEELLDRQVLAALIPRRDILLADPA